MTQFLPPQQPMNQPAAPSPCPHCRNLVNWPAGAVGTFSCPFCKGPVTFGQQVYSPQAHAAPLPPHLAPPPVSRPVVQASIAPVNDNPFGGGGGGSDNPFGGGGGGDSVNPFGSSSSSSPVFKKSKPAGGSGIAWKLIAIALLLSPLLYFGIALVVATSKYMEFKTSPEIPGFCMTPSGQVLTTQEGHERAAVLATPIALGWTVALECLICIPLGVYYVIKKE